MKVLGLLMAKPYLRGFSSITKEMSAHTALEYSPEIVGGWEAREKKKMLNKNRGMLHSYIHIHAYIHIHKILCKQASSNSKMLMSMRGV